MDAQHILMIGHDRDADVIREALAEAEDRAFTVECARLLSDGLKRLRQDGIAAVMLDLRLPDSQGVATFEQLRQAAPHVALLIINSASDQDLARHAVRRGAQDYLQKDRIDSDSLPRALRNIIERKAGQRAAPQARPQGKQSERQRETRSDKRKRARSNGNPLGATE